MGSKKGDMHRRSLPLGARGTSVQWVIYFSCLCVRPAREARALSPPRLSTPNHSRDPPVMAGHLPRPAGRRRNSVHDDRKLIFHVFAGLAEFEREIIPSAPTPGSTRWPLATR